LLAPTSSLPRYASKGSEWKVFRSRRHALIANDRDNLPVGARSEKYVFWRSLTSVSCHRPDCDSLRLRAFVITAVVEIVAGVRGVEVGRIGYGGYPFQLIAAVEYELAGLAPDGKRPGTERK
jgi:hypothetical protein